MQATSVPIITYYQKTVKELDAEKEQAKHKEFEFDSKTGSYKDKYFQMDGWVSATDPEEKIKLFPLFGVSVHKVPLFSILQGNYHTCSIISSLLGLGNLIWDSKQEINPFSVVLPKGYLDHDGIYGTCFLDTGKLKTIFMDDRFDRQQFGPQPSKYAFSEETPNPTSKFDCPRLLFTLIIEKGFMKLKDYSRKNPDSVVSRADLCLHSMTGAPADFVVHSEYTDFEQKMKELIAPPNEKKENASHGWKVLIAFCRGNKPVPRGSNMAHAFSIMGIDPQGGILVRDPYGYISGDAAPEFPLSETQLSMRKRFREKSKHSQSDQYDDKPPELVCTWKEYLEWFEATVILHYNPNFQFSSNQIQVKYVLGHKYNYTIEFKTLSPLDTEVNTGDRYYDKPESFLFYYFQLVSDVEDNLPRPICSPEGEPTTDNDPDVCVSTGKGRLKLERCLLEGEKKKKGISDKKNAIYQPIQYWGIKLQQGKTYEINFSISFTQEADVGPDQLALLKKQYPKQTNIGVVFYGRNKVKVISLTRN